MSTSSAESFADPGEEDGGLAIGTVLDGRYRIDSVLGAGGMGRVYLGEHVGIGRAVAIKVLHATMHRNREAAARFQREALASGRLDHANIVGVTDFGTLENGACFLVMEALEGESLGQRLDREDHLPMGEALAIIRDVLHGLVHAHERGVVHRDIKPDNIFLARKDNAQVVKILDFGIAKLQAGDPNDPAATGVGLTIGTPAYLSPEQAAGGEITPSSDLYSTTVVLFELLTGRAPFEAADPLAMLGAHALQAPPRAREVAPDRDLPLELDELLMRGLAKRPAERIASATDYLAALEPFLASTAAATPSGPTAVPAATVARAESSGDRTSGPQVALAVAETAMQITATPLPFPQPGKITLSAAALGATEPLGSAGRPPSRQLPINAIALPHRPAAVGTAQTLSIPAFVKKRRWPIAAFAVATIVLVIATRNPKPARWSPPASPPVTTAPIAVATPEVDGTGSAEPGGTPGATKPGSTKPGATKPGAATVDGTTAVGTVPPAAGSATPATVVVAPVDDQDAPVAGASPALTAALAQLRNAKSCPLRKAAIPKLVALKDPRAIPALERSRRRMYGGVLGMGQSNANSCLVKAANAAIKSLKK